MNKTLKQTYNPNIELYGNGNIDFGHEKAEKFFQERELEKIVRRAELNSYSNVGKKNKKVVRITANVRELKNIIKAYCKKTNKILPKKFYRMKKNQLLAIYYNFVL